MTPPRGPAVYDLIQTRRLRLAATGILLIVAAIVIGPIAGAMVAANKVWAAVFLAAVAAPVVFWKVRSAPAIFLVAAATNIERYADTSPDATTANVPLFRSFTESYGWSGAIMLPIEMIFVLALLIWIFQAAAERRLNVRTSYLGGAMAALLLIALLAEAYGLGRGGIFHISLWELRPFLYLPLSYLLASQLLERRAALEAIFWAIVTGTGLKGILGTERVITMANVYPRPPSILEHDESVFFSCYILLTVGLWVFGQRGNLRRVATALLPFVVTADLGNNRRAAWLMLPVMLIALAIIAYQRMPDRRNVIIWVVGVFLVLGSGYVAALRNSGALIAEPAHAIWSEFHPSERDANSNLYRQLEDLNLGIDIRSSPVIGEGFGVPIPHPIAVFDASSIDPLINFIPHNNILYIWLRTGAFGMVAFWFMIGAGVVAACQLARHEDPWFALFGTFILVAVIAWLTQGWLDKGIASFRIAILMGCLLGALGPARRIAQATDDPASAAKKGSGSAIGQTVRAAV